MRLALPAAVALLLAPACAVGSSQESSIARDPTPGPVRLTDAGAAGPADLGGETTHDAGAPGPHDAGAPAAPAPTCADAPVARYDTPPCSTATVDCAAGAMTSEAFWACLEADPSPDCYGCAVWHSIGCVNDHGCQEDWNCLEGCLEASCPMDYACTETTCATDFDAYQGCYDRVAATLVSGECDDAILACLPI